MISFFKHGWKDMEFDTLKRQVVYILGDIAISIALLLSCLIFKSLFLFYRLANFPQIEDEIYKPFLLLSSFWDLRVWNQNLLKATIFSLPFFFLCYTGGILGLSRNLVCLWNSINIANRMDFAITRRSRNEGDPVPRP